MCGSREILVLVEMPVSNAETDPGQKEYKQQMFINPCAIRMAQDATLCCV